MQNSTNMFQGGPLIRSGSQVLLKNNASRKLPEASRIKPDHAYAWSNNGLANGGTVGAAVWSDDFGPTERGQTFGKVFANKQCIAWAIHQKLDYAIAWSDIGPKIRAQLVLRLQPTSSTKLGHPAHAGSHCNVAQLCRTEAGNHARERNSSVWH